MNNKKLNETRISTIACVNFQVLLQLYYQLQQIFILILSHTANKIGFVRLTIYNDQFTLKINVNFMKNSKTTTMNVVI